MRSGMFDGIESRLSRESLGNFVPQYKGWETELAHGSALPRIPYLGGSRSSRTQCIVASNTSGKTEDLNNQTIALIIRQFVLGNNGLGLGSIRRLQR